MKEKSLAEKEIERLKYVLKDLEENGLTKYDEHKDIVLEIVKKKIKEDIKFWKERLEKENEIKK